MAGIDLGGILKGIFGGDPSKMDDKELAEKIEAFKEAHPRTEGVSYDDLLSIPQDKWGEYDVGMVRIVQAEGVEPCELCAPLIGKCFTLTDGRFYLDHGRKNHRAPFCLGMVPAFRVKHGSNCTLPEYPAEGVPEAPGYQVFHKWAEDVYERDHQPTTQELTARYDFEGFQLKREAYEAGEYSEFDPSGLYTCVRVTVDEAEEGQDLAWLIPVIDQSITGGLHSSRVPYAERLRGELLLQAGNKEAALAAFRHAMELNPKIGLKRKVATLEKELVGNKK